MIFLISLLLAALLVYFLGENLRKHPTCYYIGAAVIAIAVIYCTYAGVRFPTFVNTWIFPIFSRAGLAGALFIIVMITGALPNGSALIKKLMPIRGELSIIASILTLGHNIAYGKTYFVMLFTNPGRLPVNQLIAAICSVVMILIMLPLFITSFKCIRKKMQPKVWKKLQRFAYIFYALLYTHIMLLTVPYAVSGRSFYRLTVFVYSVIFISYLICRVMKAQALKSRKMDSLKSRQKIGILVGVIVSAIILIIIIAVGSVSAEEEETSDDSSSVIAQSVEVETSSGDETADDVEEAETPVSDESADTAASVSQEPENSDESETVDASETDGSTTPDADDSDTASEAEPEETESSVTTDSATSSSSSQGSQSSDGSSSSENSSSSAGSGSSSTVSSDSTESTATSGTESASSADSVSSESATVEEAEPEVTTIYKDGTYTGSGLGMNGNIVVSITIQSDIITSVSIVSSNDDDPYFTWALDVIDDILAANSADVDTVSGATWSSGGIIDAVAAALKSAKN